MTIGTELLPMDDIHNLAEPLLQHNKATGLLVEGHGTGIPCNHGKYRAGKMRPWAAPGIRGTRYRTTRGGCFSRSPQDTACARSVARIKAQRHVDRHGSNLYSISSGPKPSLRTHSIFHARYYREQVSNVRCSTNTSKLTRNSRFSLSVMSRNSLFSLCSIASWSRLLFSQA